MLIPEIRNDLLISRITEIEITVETWEEERIANPTEEELAKCPLSFRCFVCLETKGKKKFACEIRFQRICRSCFPNADDRTIRGLISFDLRRGFPVQGYPKAKFGNFRNAKGKYPELTPEVAQLVERVSRREAMMKK